MEPVLRKEAVPSDASFVIAKERSDAFSGILHVHAEYELTFIREGVGTYTMGDKIEDFSEGDLLLIGPNLPHSWRSDPGQLQCRSFTAKFGDELTGNGLLERPELRQVARLLERAPLGMKFTGETALEVGNRLEVILSMEPFDRFLNLLSVLHILATSGDYRVLSSPGYTLALKGQEDYERINTVYEYVRQHFQEKIRLEDLAFIVHMTEAAFCRYFKKVTHKTFFTFLTEVRIGHSCKLLAETDKHITEVCYESGFNSISNFNKQFKSLKGLSPQQYRQRRLAVS